MDNYCSRLEETDVSGTITVSIMMMINQLKILLSYVATKTSSHITSIATNTSSLFLYSNPFYS